MKKFALFSSEYYYPGGGIKDFSGFFDSLDECRSNLGEICDGFYHIIDTLTWELVEAKTINYDGEVEEDAYFSFSEISNNY